MLLGQAPPRGPEIWLLNERFSGGTTLFDQYRALPRPHSFDLNAASVADLAGVPSVDRPLATAILANVPYSALDDLAQVPGMTPQALAAFREMRRAMEAPPKPGTSEEGALSIKSIVLPYGWRALKVWLVCAVLAALFYAAARHARWWRLALNGLAASCAGLVAGWTIDSGNGMLAFAAPVVLFGIFAALIALWRRRSWPEAGFVLGAWALAALPAAFAVVPL
jgi:hypothetical protein